MTTRTKMYSTLIPPNLSMLAATLDDLENDRIRIDNRVRSMKAEGANKTDDTFILLSNLADEKLTHEKLVIKELNKTLKSCDLHPWIKAQKGLGDKTVARLLHSIGDPYWHNVEERPRTVSELWAYVGYRVDAGQTQQRRKGVQSNWNGEARKRIYLIAETCMKTGTKGGGVSRYRQIYLDRRARTAVTRPTITDGNSHADALRVLGKEILKDLWIESKRLHEFHQYVEKVEIEED